MSQGDELEHKAERDAFVKLDPDGFYIRHPPRPHELDAFITPDDQLFQTIHMGGAVVDMDRWKLIITGLVENPLTLTLRDLHKEFPTTTITSFHECFGSPLKPATEALWRIGNVQWTGVPLNEILRRARPLPEAKYVWSEGLDRGTFAGVEATSYQKDLPLDKAISDEVLLAFSVNGQPLSKNRGGPVRLVVPGWFGTNSTKWLCRLELQNRRAPGPYTTKFYNVPNPQNGTIEPVWKVEPNSMITKPAPDAKLPGPVIEVEGWAWSPDRVSRVDVSVDRGVSWTAAELDGREGFSWQRFHTMVRLGKGRGLIMAKATGSDGRTQPVGGHRNHCHSVECDVDMPG